MSSASYSLAAPGLATSTGIANANPWALLPPLGNLDAYISAVNRLPMLTLEQGKPLRANFVNRTTWHRLRS